jgi:hypothetical protein
MPRPPLILLALCALNSGCRLWVTATWNLVHEAVQCTDEVFACIRYHKMANAAWDAVGHAPPQGHDSQDYADGWKEGFAEYLKAGGSVVPPPPRYWTVHYQTPEGHRAMTDWLAGYRDGAAAADASGYRAWVILPTSPPSHEFAVPGPIGPGTVPAPGDEPMMPPGSLLPHWAVPPSECDPALPGEPVLPMPRQLPTPGPTGPGTVPAPADEPMLPPASLLPRPAVPPSEWVPAPPDEPVKPMREQIPAPAGPAS